MQNITLNDLVCEKSPLLARPLTFLDTSGLDCKESSDSEHPGSYCNLIEVKVVRMILQRYLDLGIACHQIGVITPYWSQIAELTQALEDLPEVEISSVDGFQGSERELIIVSMVRSNKKGDVGFLAEERRLNVTLTRAKRACVVIGDCDTLVSDPGIASFVNHCRRNHCLESLKDYL